VAYQRSAQFIPRILIPRAWVRGAIHILVVHCTLQYDGLYHRLPPFFPSTTTLTVAFSSCLRPSQRHNLSFHIGIYPTKRSPRRAHQTRPATTHGEEISRPGPQRSIAEAGSKRMASSYVLPASAMTHSHHGHAHAHAHAHSHSHSPSHSRSPSRQLSYSANTPISLKQERSNGSLHSYSYSESHHDHGHEHSHSHSHGHERGTSPYVEASLYNTEPEPRPGKQALPQFDPNASPVKTDNIPLHEHDHYGHNHGHSRPTVAAAEPQSRFTSFVLPLALRWPLLHTILAEKDSRRIFYFMRCVTLENIARDADNI
jgi:hypothetical protein